MPIKEQLLDLLTSVDVLSDCLKEGVDLVLSDAVMAEDCNAVTPTDLEQIQKDYQSLKDMIKLLEQKLWELPGDPN